MALNNVPLAGQNLLVTRDPINQNWVTINTGFLANHNELGTAGVGKHKYLQMPVQAAVPITVAAEAGFYAVTGTTSGVTELAFSRDAGITGIAFTETALAGNGGWTMLPSGLILQWGFFNIAGTAHPTFPKAFPSACYSVTLTVADVSPHNHFVMVSAVVAAGFTAQTTSRSGVPDATDVYYQAIGV